MRHLDTVDVVRALAEAQHGVVSRRQLLDLGMDREQIRSWLRHRRLVPHRRGVYTLGHRLLNPRGRWMGAVLACGPSAVLSHRSAAVLWGLRSTGGSTIDVTVGPEGARRPGEGISVHRSALVWPEHATRADGIPTTTVAWTLLELAATLRSHQLRRAVEAAEQQRLFDLRAVRRALEADPGRPGSRALRSVVDDMRDHGVTRTRSDVEAQVLQICIDDGLPRPQVNHYDNGREVDFRWADEMLIVEIDGWQFHNSRRAFAADRARDRAALKAGWRVARFPADEVFDDAGRVAAELLDLLRQR